MQLRRLRFIAAETKDKAYAILAKIYPGGLYGVEANDVSEHLIAKLFAAVLDVFRCQSDIHDADFMYTALSNGTHKELDPTVQILIRRSLEMRRAICKRPGSLIKIQIIFKLYEENMGIPRSG